MSLSKPVDAARVGAADRVLDQRRRRIGLRDYLNYICEHHHPGTQTGGINSLVVTDVAIADTTVALTIPGVTSANDALATTRLDELLPFLGMGCPLLVAGFAPWIGLAIRRSR